ncbi:MAG: heavy metal-binding domain-containing protein [Pseudomonadota bacterium]|nr:heavy metal-binding domain-containing protein [Pseudomonadota bacterium]
MKKVHIISTTSSIDGYEIKEYLGLVTSQIVVGANVFKDIFAAFTDFFGGQSSAYQSELEKMETLAIRDLHHKAHALRANAIIGLKVDYDEISGQGKSMFMLSMIGTAVLAEKLGASMLAPTEGAGVSTQELSDTMTRIKLEKALQSDKLSLESHTNLKSIINYKVDASKYLFRLVEECPSFFNENKEIVSLAFSMQEQAQIEELITDEFLDKIPIDAFERFLWVYKEKLMMNYDLMLKKLDSSNPIVLSRTLQLLDTKKKVYKEDDIQKIALLIDRLDDVFSIFPIKESKKGMLGKEKEVWVCPRCQSKTPIAEKTCSNQGCLSNVYGVPRGKLDVSKVKEIYKEQMSALSDIFQSD